MRRSNLRLIALTVMALAINVPAHAAETETGTYVAGEGLVVEAPRPPGSPVPRVAVGGYNFGHHTTRATKIKLVDTVGSAGIRVTVCGNTCSGFTKEACTNGAGEVTLTGTPTNSRLYVFIYPADEDGECEGVATTGTVTATYA